MKNVPTVRPQTFSAPYRFAFMDETCPNCDADPGDYCYRPDGQYRRTPCLLRMKPRPAQPSNTRPTLTVAK
jgi:hypothetical protein